jgi:D-serine deaminase-like pyridoxal phosphate-dependent protein
MHGEPLPGITEMRPGTYILMDAAQGHAINDYSQCAVSVLATVISKPTAERVVLIEREYVVAELPILCRGKSQ